MTTCVACLTCKHAHFIPHADWKPAYQGDTYQYRHVVDRIREKQLHEKAKCTFNPVWLDVFTSHHCGRWEDGRHFHDKVELRELIFGTWMQTANQELREEVALLKVRLKNSQKMSMSRLLRLKKDQK